jgi:hypothetical protein
MSEPIWKLAGWPVLLVIAADEHVIGSRPRERIAIPKFRQTASRQSISWDTRVRLIEGVD